MRATGSRAVRMGTPSLPHSVNEPGEITLRHSGGPGCRTGLGRKAGGWVFLDFASLGSGASRHARSLVSTASALRSRPSWRREPSPPDLHALFAGPLSLP